MTDIPNSVDEDQAPSKTRFLDAHVKVRWVLPAYALVVVTAFLAVALARSDNRADIAYLAYQDARFSYVTCINRGSLTESQRFLLSELAEFTIDDPAEALQFEIDLNERFQPFDPKSCGEEPVSPYAPD